MNGFRLRKTKEKISIGILACGTGCGATHLAISLANYLYSVAGKRTAVIELSSENQLDTMIRKQGDAQNSLLGVRYYTSVDKFEMPKLLNERYEAFVLDLGTDYMAVREEFLRCDHKVVTGSISPWRESEYAAFLKLLKSEQYYEWQYLCLFGERHDKKRFEKEHGIHMLGIPWIGNPFRLKKEDIYFLRKLT